MKNPPLWVSIGLMAIILITFGTTALDVVTDLPGRTVGLLLILTAASSLFALLVRILRGRREEQIDKMNRWRML